ncbi:MAG TPA: glycoside hydrolase [Hanamia sp.]|nr:glycoside hydrolase [Hanamia sp.]
MIFNPNIKPFCLIIFCLASLVSFAQKENGKTQTLLISIDLHDRLQTIENIGASGCWYAEPIGRYWPPAKKDRIARLLFSREIDKEGNPAGIGLSAWRFNIGGGTEEQGGAGGIKDVNHRVECFLNADGSYDWSKQSGYQWFLKKAKEYGVENLIAFSNTPPVQFTKNGRGFKTEKSDFSNLATAKYKAYVDFLSEVISHFDKKNLHFDFISPVNEPQWDWSGAIGEVKQEGSPWTNEEIFHVVGSLDSSLKSRALKTKILIPEAGMLTYSYGNNTSASKQIQNFFSDTSALNFKKFKSVPPIVAAHSYFTEGNDTSLINIRQTLADTAKKYGVNYWQSEYCMLGDGYKERALTKRTDMDCALFLAKVIHTDLVVGNATAWQFWNSFEPGKADFDTRYYLIALSPDPGFKSGNFTVTKNLWALGHYSLFVRPGMQRLNIHRSDRATNIEATQKVMVSAFAGKNGELIIVAINYESTQHKISLELKHSKRIGQISAYVTTAEKGFDMKYAKLKGNERIALPPRSITTLVINKSR